MREMTAEEIAKAKVLEASEHAERHREEKPAPRQFNRAERRAMISDMKRKRRLARKAKGEANGNR